MEQLPSRRPRANAPGAAFALLLVSRRLRRELPAHRHAVQVAATRTPSCRSGPSSACSIGVSASFFFLWNYFINFRTDRRKRDACRATSRAVALHVGALLRHAHSRSSTSTRTSPSASAASRSISTSSPRSSFLAGLKFFLYHKWVFPLPAAGAVPANAGKT